MGGGGGWEEGRDKQIFEAHNTLNTETPSSSNTIKAQSVKTLLSPLCVPFRAVK